MLLGDAVDEECIPCTMGVSLVHGARKLIPDAGSDQKRVANWSQDNEGVGLELLSV